MKKITAILVLPLLIILSVVLSNGLVVFMAPNQATIVQTVLLLIPTALSLIVINYEKSLRESLLFGCLYNKNLSSMANTAISVVFGGSIIFIAENSPNKNPIDLVIWIIALGVLFSITLLVGISFNLRKNHKQWLTFVEFFLKVFTIILFGMGILRHFGTQFVWIPVLGILLILLLWSHSTRIFSENLNEKGWITTLPIFIGVISTIYQFWFTELFLGIELWILLAFLVGIFVIILLSFYFKNKIKQRKILKKEKEEEQRKEMEKRRKEAEVLSQIVSITQKDYLTWDDLFFAFNHFKTTNNIPQSILKKVSNLSLSGLITISNYKRKIIWRDDFKLALKIIDDIVYATYEDKEIKPLVTMVQNFLSYVEKVDQFHGYQELEAEVMRHYVCKFLQ